MISRSKIDPKDLTLLSLEDLKQMPGGGRVFIADKASQYGYATIKIPTIEDKDIGDIDWWRGFYKMYEQKQLYRRISKPWQTFDHD